MWNIEVNSEINIEESNLLINEFDEIKWKFPFSDMVNNLLEIRKSMNK